MYGTVIFHFLGNKEKQKNFNKILNQTQQTNDNLIIKFHIKWLKLAFFVKRTGHIILWNFIKR